jgi:S1-C subfamily serine protease
MEFQSCRRDRFAVVLAFLCLAALFLKAPPASAQTVTNTIENSVVKVFSTVRYPDLYQPWTKRSPSDITGSGVVIAGKRILSNAHMVLYASQVQIQANQAGDKISATVEAVAPGIDLAVLKLDDESFFDTHQPLPFSTNLPGIKDAVMAYGYPEGGTGLSITKGIVSRIEFTPYNYPVCGLRIQIDAAINPGNSGGPAVVGDHMIGLAFSHYREAQNIGYIIPCEEIELFLADVADGHYDGKPAMYDDYQTLENPALRQYLKAGKSVEGVVVHKPDSNEPGYPLKQWDIITRIGDTPIDDQGMVKIGGDLRVNFPYLVQKIAKDGKVPMTIVRAGKEMKVELPVSPNHPLLIPDLDGAYPSYFIFGPLVFSAASKEFSSGFLDSASGSRYISWLMALGSPLISRSGDKAGFEDEGLVVVSSPFFPHKLAKGYSAPYGQVVKTVNGIPIRNLKHLVEVLRDSKDEYVTIEFDSRAGETLVFPREQTIASTDEILTDNGIRSQGSADTVAVWNEKAAGK